MITESDLDPGCGGEIVNAVLAPFLRVLPKCDPARIRINVTPGPEGCLDRGVPRIGLAAPGEVLFALPAVVITPADLPPVALAVVGCGIELRPCSVPSRGRDVKITASVPASGYVACRWSPR
jgi:hypothetical protein